MNAYEKALSLLARREHSKRELKDKLKSKGYSKDEIDSAIERLESEGSLSEKRFIEAYIAHFLKKGESAMKLKATLLEKGCERDQIDEYVNEMRESDEYFEAIRKTINKAFSEKEEGKAFLSLARKGFTPHEIKKVRNASS